MEEPTNPDELERARIWQRMVDAVGSYENSIAPTKQPKAQGVSNPGTPWRDHPNL